MYIATVRFNDRIYVGKPSNDGLAVSTKRTAPGQMVPAGRYSASTGQWYDAGKAFVPKAVRKAFEKAFGFSS